MSTEQTFRKRDSAAVYLWQEAVCMCQPCLVRAIAEMRRQLSQDIESLFLADACRGSSIVNGATASGVDAASAAAELPASRPT